MKTCLCVYALSQVSIWHHAAILQYVTLRNAWWHQSWPGKTMQMAKNVAVEYYLLLNLSLCLECNNLCENIVEDLAMIHKSTYRDGQGDEFIFKESEEPEDVEAKNMSSKSGKSFITSIINRFFAFARYYVLSWNLRVSLTWGFSSGFSFSLELIEFKLNL